MQAIKVRNINKTINGKKILHDISFDIYEGEIVGLVGLRHFDISGGVGVN